MKSKILYHSTEKEPNLGQAVLVWINDCWDQRRYPDNIKGDFWWMWLPPPPDGKTESTREYEARLVELSFKIDGKVDSIEKKGLTVKRILISRIIFEDFIAHMPESYVMGETANCLYKTRIIMPSSDLEPNEVEVVV